MLKKLRRYRDTFRHKPTDSDSDSDPYDPMPPKTNYASPSASQITTSRTLYYAQQGRLLVPSAGKPSSSSARQGSVGPRTTPDSSAARYWAARAVTAEVLLAERSKHAHELRGVIHEEDAKRKVRLQPLFHSDPFLITVPSQEEIAALHGAHEARQRKMEWIVVRLHQKLKSCCCSNHSCDFVLLDMLRGGPSHCRLVPPRHTCTHTHATHGGNSFHNPSALPIHLSCEHFFVLFSQARALLICRLPPIFFLRLNMRLRHGAHGSLFPV